MKKLLMLAVAVMAFAIPASASAHDGLDFTHEGNFVESTTEVTLTGEVGFNQGTNTVRCPEVDITLDLLDEGTGEVTGFDCINGKLNETFLVDDTATNVHSWDVEAIGHNHIEISGIQIDNTYTHPTLGVCVGGSVVTGAVTASFVTNPENDSTVELENNTANELTSNGAEAEVFGELHAENTNGDETKIGIATT